MACSLLGFKITSSSFSSRAIFDRFYRVDKSHSSTVEGSGLGLSIVEAIVRMHGGEISYDVDECGMNCFDVKLVAKRVG
jgi:signal transduction histidine kinase